MSDADSPRRGSDRSRSPSPVRDDERRRSLSRSRSRSPDARRRSVSRSRSRSPARGGGRSRSPGGPPVGWRDALERIYARGEIRKGDLDDEVLSSLEAMADDEANCVVGRIGETDISRVRNLSRFVSGIIRRVKQDGPDRGEANLDSLPKPISKRLQELVDDGKFEQRDLDQRLVRALGDLSERNAEEALRRYSQSADGSIRSRQGFLMGIIKRINEEERGGGGGGGGGGGYRGGGGGGDRYGGDRYGGGGGGDRYGGGGGDRYGGGGYGGGGGGGYGRDDRGYSGGGGGSSYGGYGGRDDRYGREDRGGHGGYDRRY